MNALLLYESLRPTHKEQISFRIEDPIEVLQCFDPGQLFSILQRAQEHAQNGRWVAGFVCYEAGCAFLPGIRTRKPGLLPYAWFAVCDQPEFSVKPSQARQIQVKDPQLNVTIDEYRRSITSIKDHIARGDTYQVNYTARYHAAFAQSSYDLYLSLRERQKVNYAAYIDTDEWAIVSLSPELFFRKSGEHMEMRPMKGTMDRGRTNAEDERKAQALRSSDKEVSENLMIVDMLRNDLGKICVPGTVQVSAAMQVERYETLFQMTSTIEGTLRKDCGIPEIFQAAFPSGSITGAPKIRTMQIIDSLETTPRGIYTGAIGYMHGEDSVFNVAIRTVMVNHREKQLEMGVGSGILYEADADREFQECVLKARFLTEPYRPFELFETILWTPNEGFARLEYHMDRLEQSAEYFLFDFSRTTPLDALMHLGDELRTYTEPRRIRLVLSETGNVTLQHATLEPIPQPSYACLATETVSSNDRFFYHKTTRRDLYERELKTARTKGFFDAIFCNEKGEVTEGSISNVFIRRGDVYLTPPVECGLLAGTYRRWMFESGEYNVREERLRVEDLRSAEGIFLTNALRGLLPVELKY